MSRKRRIQKSQQQRLQDLETHLYFLWEARQLFPTQHDRFKQIASGLRILACDHRASRRLLLSLMAECGFQRVVNPPGPPFDKRPIPIIGWRNDPQLKKLAADVEVAAGDSEKLDQLLEMQAALRRPMPIDEYVDTALAVMVEQQDFSYGQLVRAIAQQLGGSHEDQAVDDTLVVMEQSVIGKLEGHLVPLIHFTDLVLEIGMEFLTYMSESHGYEPRRFLRVKGKVCPPSVDSWDVPEVPNARAAKPAAGSDVQAQGTLSIWLTHAHADWVTNSDGYNFGQVSMAGVSLHAVKEPAGFLRLRFEKRSGVAATIEHVLQYSGVAAVHVAATWKGSHVRFYVDGSFVGEMALS